MFNVIVFVIISIVLLNRIQNALNETKNDLQRDIRRSLDLIRLKLEELTNRIAPELSKDKDASKLAEPDEQTQEVPQRPIESIREIIKDSTPPKKQALYPKTAVSNSAPVSKVERQKSKLEEGVNDILKKIWSWI